MKLLSVILVTAVSSVALAQAPVSQMGLNEFLSRVKKQSPEVSAALRQVNSLKDRLDEGDLILSPQGYAKYGYEDNEQETSNPSFMGYKTQSGTWSVGVKKQTQFGLSANLHLDYDHVIQFGVNTAFVPQPDYQESHAVLELQQSFWKNGFGEETSAKVRAARAANRASYLKAKYQLKNLLLSAEDIYWSVASLNRIVDLQKANIERAKKLAARMGRRAKANLVDDVDALQSEAALEARELELKQSLEQKNEMLRQFHALLGENSMDDVLLDPLPSKEWRAQLNTLGGPDRFREDFQAQREMAHATKAQARSSRSDLKPEFDLVASYSTNGRSTDWQDSVAGMETTHHPDWRVGVNFSVPLDFGLVKKLKSGYSALENAANDQIAAANLYESRTWRQLVQKRQDAQDEYERAAKIEKLRSKIVQREHQLLKNGRTTTFQTLSDEQDLATSQINEIRAQLTLIQIHNQIKAFSTSAEESL